MGSDTPSSGSNRTHNHHHQTTISDSDLRSLRSDKETAEKKAKRYKEKWTKAQSEIERMKLADDAYNKGALDVIKLMGKMAPNPIPPTTQAPNTASDGPEQPLPSETLQNEMDRAAMNWHCVGCQCEQVSPHPPRPTTQGGTNPPSRPTRGGGFPADNGGVFNPDIPPIRYPLSPRSTVPHPWDMPQEVEEISFTNPFPPHVYAPANGIPRPSHHSSRKKAKVTQRDNQNSATQSTPGPHMGRQRNDVATTSTIPTIAVESATQTHTATQSTPGPQMSRQANNVATTSAIPTIAVESATQPHTATQSTPGPQMSRQANNVATTSAIPIITVESATQPHTGTQSTPGTQMSRQANNVMIILGFSLLTKSDRY